MTGMRFFVVGGVILILSAALQLVVRPRKPNEHRFLNRATVWAAFCLVMGLAAILVGAGLVPLGARPG